MGSGRDKRKKLKERKEGPQAGTGASKTEKHTKSNEDKKMRRADRKLEGDEDDIDAILAKLSIDEEAKATVNVKDDCPPPSPRVNASFTPYITPKSKEIWMFGGECVDVSADKVYVFGDLLKLDLDKQRWTSYTCPSSPPPRSAHQAAVVKGNLYIFGGEFTSPNQVKFHHYKDLWRLHLGSVQWDNLPSRGGPSARSGHRMVAYKSKLIVFGGFYDTGREVRYYNDLWEFDTEELKWSSVGDPKAQRPSPRSGCQLAVHGDTLVLYGGYSKRADDEDPDIETGKVHDDMWVLDLQKYTWEKVKKAGMGPPPRASFSMVPHKNRLMLFGGVADNEAKGGEDLSSTFHNDLYQFNLVNRRWFAAELRAPKKSKQEQLQDTPSTSQQPSTSASISGQDDGVAKEQAALAAAGQDPTSALYKAAVRIQSRFRGYVVRKAYKVYKLGGTVSEILYSPAAFGLDMSVRNMPKPRPRISAMVCVVGNVLWLLGGTVEVGSREITLDDLWSLDLAKMDGWQLHRGNTAGEELFVEGDDSEWEEAGLDDGSDDEDED